MTGMLDLLLLYGPQLLIGQYPVGPIGGLALTLMLSVAVLTLALPLALVVGVARTAPRVWVRLAATG